MKVKQSASKSKLRLSEHELPVPAENVAQGQRHIVLKRLQLAVNFDVPRLGFGRFGWIQLDEMVRDLLNRDFLALLAAPAPERLQSGSVSRAFADFERHHLGIENVGHDLAPDF